MKCAPEAIGFLASAVSFGLLVAGVVTGPPGWIMLGTFATIVGAGASTGGVITCATS